MPGQLLSDYLTEASPFLPGAATHEVLIAESNHRIANNLTLIAGILRLQANDIAQAGQTLAPQEVGVLLAEVGARIETVGRLHRLLAQSGGCAHIDLRAYLQEIAEAALHSMSGRQVALVSPEGPPCRIPAQQALSVGFIVGEAVTNAVKYAHPGGAPGRLRVECRRRADGATGVEVVDDGVGLPEGFDPDHDGGLGLRLMRTIAGQLGARLAFERGALGFAVVLTLPPNRPVCAP